MPDDELLGIGAFALLGGLTIDALRHYDEVGLLPPAHVDPDTRYRYYRRGQLALAQLVRALREVEMPLDGVRAFLSAGEEERQRLLTAQRERLAADAERAGRRLQTIDHYLEKGVPVTTTTTGNRMVMVNLPVRELAPARTFYASLLDVEFAEERHGDGPAHLDATFGEWSTPSWFLLSLWPDPEHAGAGDVGFLVEDLDDAHARALAAGGEAVEPPHDATGMPRHAIVRDPSGNHVGLYQG